MNNRWKDSVNGCVNGTTVVYVLNVAAARVAFFESDVYLLSVRLNWPATQVFNVSTTDNGGKWSACSCLV